MGRSCVALVRCPIGWPGRIGGDLRASGVETLIHYPIPPHLQQAYAELGLPKGSFPLAETLAETVLSLPMGPHMKVEAVDEVARAVRSALAAT